jgi:hypothetical protein
LTDQYDRLYASQYLTSIFNRQEHQQKHYQREPQDFLPQDVSTKVVVLGSGSPFPNPHRMGPSFGVVANGMPYFVDGGEGI